MAFAQRRNRLTTHFSERIPVVKRLHDYINKRTYSAVSHITPSVQYFRQGLWLITAHAYFHFLKKWQILVNKYEQVSSPSTARFTRRKAAPNKEALTSVWPVSTRLDTSQFLAFMQHQHKIMNQKTRTKSGTMKTSQTQFSQLPQ